MSLMGSVLCQRFHLHTHICTCAYGWSMWNHSKKNARTRSHTHTHTNTHTHTHTHSHAYTHTHTCTYLQWLSILYVLVTPGMCVHLCYFSLWEHMTVLNYDNCYRSARFTLPNDAVSTPPPHTICHTYFETSVPQCTVVIKTITTVAILIVPSMRACARSPLPHTSLTRLRTYVHSSLIGWQCVWHHGLYFGGCVGYARSIRTQPLAKHSFL